MNKKIISTIMALIMTLMISFPVFAAMPKGTVVIGNKAYTLGYANDSQNIEEITKEVVTGNKIYIKNFGGSWINNSTGLVENRTVISAVVYKDGVQIINYAIEDGNIEEPLTQEIKDSAEMLKQKITFDNDISVFTLFAFMNFTGYDDENNNLGFSNVRKLIREDLNKMNLTLNDNNYYKNKNISCSRYINVLSKSNGAPNFTVDGRLPNYLSELSDLSIRLKEFYEKANIEELYKKYNSFYMEETNRYSQAIYSSLAKTNKFLKINYSEVPEFYLQVNLLDAYGRGYGLSTQYKYKGRILIVGPSNALSLVTVTHEYLHAFITPIDNEIQSEIEQLSFLMSSVPANTQATSSSYNNWFSIFDESLIRALDNEFTNNGINYDVVAEQQGFILTKYFNKRFKDFEKFDGSLKEFIIVIINEIKANPDIIK
jgi:hypothetical protein